jgi:amino acid permease
MDQNFLRQGEINGTRILQRLQSTFHSKLNYIRAGSPISTVTILLASCIGPSMLVVPECIYDLGIYLGLALLLLALFINCFATYCLILASEKTGRITYKGLGDVLYGRKYGTLFEILMVLACYLRITLFLIRLGSMIAHKFSSGVESQPWIWYTLIAILIFP